MSSPDSGNHSSSRLALLALSLALLGAAAMVYYHLGLFMPHVLEVGATRNLAGRYAFGDDFYPVWVTSREWLRERRDPYSAEVTRDIQQGLFGRPLDARTPTDPLTDYRTFAYPAFTDLLFWPAAEFPFPVVRVVVVASLGALTLASVLLWMGALSWRVNWRWATVIVVLTLASYPVLEGLYAGQLGLLVGFLLTASMLALRRGRFLLSGILMAFTTIKPQMSALVILYLLVWTSHDWRARGRFCIGLFSTGILLVGTALAVWPRWIQSWIHVVLGYHRYARPPLVGEVFAEPLGTSAAGPATLLMIALLLIVAMMVAWRNRAAATESSEFWFTLSVLLAITSVTLISALAVYDHVILLPGIFLLASRWEAWASTWARKLLLALGVAVLLWPWMAALSVIALRPLLTDQQFYSKAVLALPLRTAAAFPFVVLGLLALAMRHAPSEGLASMSAR
jgi:Glycosyltransferase family 87